MNGYLRDVREKPDRYEWLKTKPVLPASSEPEEVCEPASRRLIGEPKIRL